MTDPARRYAGAEVATVTMPDGAGGVREVRYLRRRFLPAPDDLQTLAEHTVTRGDRPDLVTAAYLGDPTQFWRVCDANLVVHPGELTADDRIGSRIRIPIPRP
ncbi:LysM domain-containing protein [Microbispora sp. NPDC049125]|uniref:LysM domain-containing protein n=1 Tax=Microbispora sp. NPDC049125 TaxID=3154929 RepID=UPI0034677984